MKDRPVNPTSEPLVQLDCQCPKCGRKEARRVASWRLELYKRMDPERLCETVRCGNCSQLYGVKAAAYQEAS